MKLKFIPNFNILCISVNYLLFLNILKSEVNICHFTFNTLKIYISTLAALYEKEELQSKIKSFHSIKSQSPHIYKLSLNLFECHRRKKELQS